jgi:hypothetical protein
VREEQPCENLRNAVRARLKRGALTERTLAPDDLRDRVQDAGVKDSCAPGGKAPNRQRVRQLRTIGSGQLRPGFGDGHHPRRQRYRRTADRARARAIPPLGYSERGKNQRLVADRTLHQRARPISVTGATHLPDALGVHRDGNHMLALRAIEPQLGRKRLRVQSGCLWRCELCHRAGAQRRHNAGERPPTHGAQPPVPDDSASRQLLAHSNPVLVSVGTYSASAGKYLISTPARGRAGLWRHSDRH